MIAKAQGKFLRISPTKVRQVIALLRNKGAREAEAVLLHLNKGASKPLAKILKQAVANAKVKGFTADKLYISRIICDVGPSWKRFKAAAFGRATSIRKRTAHIEIELETKT